MRYKLFENGSNNTKNVLKEVLNNRGINDYSTYLNLNDSVVIPYIQLDHIEDAVQLFDKHFQSKNCIGIIPDSDVDGQCSSAELSLYIKRKGLLGFVNINHSSLSINLKINHSVHRHLAIDNQSLFLLHILP